MLTPASISGVNRSLGIGPCSTEKLSRRRKWRYAGTGGLDRHQLPAGLCRKHEFDRRGVKIIGLSVDLVAQHAGWALTSPPLKASRRTTRSSVTSISPCKAHDMLPASASGDSAHRSAAGNQTVRNVFVIGPDKKIKLILVYPMTAGRNLRIQERTDHIRAYTRCGRDNAATDVTAARKDWRPRHARRGASTGACEHAVTRAFV
jgi:alkyl hydroperoxide reductase subunit AhpC